MIYILSFAMLYGLLPFLYFLFVKKRILNKIQAVLPFLILVFVSAIYEFVFTVLLRWDSSNWFMSYCIISFFTIYYFYSKVLIKIKQTIKITSLALFISLLLFLIFEFQKNDFLIICSFIDAYITVFVFVFSILWFKMVFQELEFESLWDSPFFYIISGLILYYFGNFFLFMMTEIIYNNDKNLIQYYWILNIILNLVLRTLLIVGIWKARVK